MSRRYFAALQKHLEKGSRGSANVAERLGSQALSAGLGTLDLARIHEQAMMALLMPESSTKLRNGRVKQAALFFIEALAPIEKTRRAAVEGNGHLHQLNETLSSRTVDLAAANRKLKQEIARRQVVENALIRSEKHHQELFEQSHRMQEQLRRLSHRILSAHEEERKEISRELHDEIGQSLTGISVTLAALTREASIGTRGLKRKIARTQRLVEKSMKVVHQFARELRPSVLDDLGLIPALHSYMKEFGRRTHLHVRFKAIGAVERLDSDKRTALYRVTQEALTNVAKHANATRASVIITRNVQGAFSLEIHDNGKSFQVEHELRRKNKRLGLVGMRERVEMVGGRFTVQSEAGKGTTIRAEIPFRKDRVA